MFFTNIKYISQRWILQILAQLKAILFMMIKTKIS